MEIKAFKEGIAQLSAFTNQRAKEPEPFMIQYGKDNVASLIAANENGTVVWPLTVHSVRPAKYGVPSKMLYQAAKVLKGKGEVYFSYNEEDMTVEVAGGGKIVLPYGELPTVYHKPDKGYEPWIDQLDWQSAQKCLKAVTPTRENYCVVTPVAPGQTVTCRLTASNGYVVWEARLAPTEDVSGPLAFNLDAVLDMKALPKDSILSLGERSIKLTTDSFSLYTRLLDDSEFIHYPSLKDKHYPASKRPQVTVEINAKVLAGAIKSVAPNTKDQQFRLTVSEDRTLTVSGIQHEGSVSNPTRTGWGTGTVSLGAAYVLPVLEAFGTSSILVVFGHPSNPVGFRLKDNPYESFLIAPVFKV